MSDNQKNDDLGRRHSVAVSGLVAVAAESERAWGNLVALYKTALG
jgi:hypothetical protein